MTLLRSRAPSSSRALPSTDGPAAAEPRPSFRPDVQGLRAVAIVIVVLDHVLGWPAGGFVGVDVFFVISGFLITGLLVKEHRRDGRISLAAFYRRRVRRILPAAVVALLGTTLAAWFLTPGAAFRQIALDAVSGAFSFANWRFAATGTDYFAQTGVTSPLQHFWSLSVEEQFYFVWPVLLILLLGSLAAGSRIIQRGGVLVAAGLLLGSFAFSCWQSGEAPTVAYFSTLTRGWELGAGALLALLSGRVALLPPRFAAILSRVGLAVIAAAVLIVRPDSAFPGPLALLPVAGALLVIGGGIPTEVRVPTILANRAAVFLGSISYSWYLWHFPVVTLFERIAAPGLRRSVSALLLGLALAWLSHRFVERPFIVGRAGRRQQDRLVGRDDAAKPRSNAVVLVLALIVAAGSFGIVAPAVAARAAGGAVAADASAAHAEQVPGTPAAALEGDLIAALRAKAWPALTPSAAEVAQLGTPAAYDATCSATVVEDPRSCSFGAAHARSIVVFGDSLGITLLPTVVEAYGRDRHVRGLTLAGCAVADVEVAFGDAAGRKKCLAMRAAAIREVQRTKPDLVLMIENSNWIERLASGATADGARAEWQAGVQRSVAALRRGAAEVAVVSPSPDDGTGIAECATPGSVPAACVTTPPPAWFLARKAESAVVGATYLDTAHWYCVQSVCPSFSRTTPVKRDFVHPTVQYAHRLVADFRVMTSPLLVQG